MRTEIKKLHAKVRSTVIYVTHDQVEAMTLADRIVIMRDGYIEQVGTPDEVFRRPATRFVAGFIGSPPDEPRRGDGGGRQADAGRWRRACRCRGSSRARWRRGSGWCSGCGPTTSTRPVTACIRARPRTCTGERLPVSITEPLGNETLVFAEFAGRDWVARMLNPQVRSGRAKRSR